LLQAGPKWLLRRPAVKHALEWVAAGYVRLVFVTSRWQWIGNDESIRLLQTPGQSAICAFWHGRLLMMFCAWRTGGDRMHVLISGHRDGLFIANVTHKLGMEVVEGSTSKGGAKALRDLIQLLADGDCIAITPDGPRGPRGTVAVGTMALARLSGKPVIPFSFGVTRGIQLKTWDRFLLPLPFSRGVFAFAAPQHFSREIDDTTASERLRLALNEATRMADEATGRAYLP
jgi:lysophospholipid acyltransferase (LPLAT)-like uncharacterized protein